MNNHLTIQKLNQIKSTIVPTLFTERQFQVLIKHLNKQPLTQTERNYLSNAIKHKLKAITACKDINIEQQQYNKQRILASYEKAGITFHGATTTTPYSATTTVKHVLANYEELNARIVNALPVFIAKQVRNLDLLDIYTFSRERGITNFTGYLFAIANHFVKKPKITTFLRQLKKDPFLVAKNPDVLNAKDIMSKDAISQEWNVLTLNTIDSYQKYFELYA